MEQDIKDLWEAFEKLSSQQLSVNERISRAENETNERLARIEVLLSERCMMRGDNLADLNVRIVECERKIWFFSGAAAVISIIGSWILDLIRRGN